MQLISLTHTHTHTHTFALWAEIEKYMLDTNQVAFSLTISLVRLYITTDRLAGLSVKPSLMTIYLLYVRPTQMHTSPDVIIHCAPQKKCMDMVSDLLSLMHSAWDTCIRWSSHTFLELYSVSMMPWASPSHWTKNAGKIRRNINRNKLWEWKLKAGGILSDIISHVFNHSFSQHALLQSHNSVSQCIRYSRV